MMLKRFFYSLIGLLLLASSHSDARVARGSQTFPTTRVQTTEGDSITVSHPSNGFEYAINQLANPAFTTFNWKGQSGSTLKVDLAGNTNVNLYFRQATDLALIDATKSNIFIPFIGANDVGVYDTPLSQWLADDAAYNDSFRAAGASVVCATVAARNTTSPYTNFAADRATVNTEIRKWTVNGSVVPGKHCDFVADFGGDAKLGDDAGPALGNDTGAAGICFGSDGLHWTAYCHARARDLAQPWVDAAKSNVHTPPTINTLAYASEAGGPDTIIQLFADRGVFWSLSGASGLAMYELSSLQLTNNTAGSYTGTLSARDGLGRITSGTFTWTVSAPPGGGTLGPNLVKNPSANNIQIGWAPLTIWFKESATIWGIPSDGVSAANSVSASASTPITAVSDGAGGTCFRITGDSVANLPFKRQTIATIAGKTYQFSGKLRAGTSPSAIIVNGTKLTNATTSYTTVTNTFTAGGTSVNIDLVVDQSPATGYAEFDDIQLRQQLP